MQPPFLYSVMLELRAQREAYLPATTGHQVHAMFLQLVAQVDPVLAARLHDEPGYRPFTLSPLLGGEIQGNRMVLSPGRTYAVRVTLLDGGQLWHCLSTPLLEAGPCRVRLGEASLTLTRLISTAAADATGWASRTSWQQLATSPRRHTISLCFASPTAFNMNGDYFALFPEPLLVWDSLLRTWNRYAPDTFTIEKQTLRSFLRSFVNVSACDDLATHTLHYPKYTQKGFTGICRYQVDGDDTHAGQLTALAEFARYSGVGYKTTMGMGQVRIEDDESKARSTDLLREVEVQ